MIRSILLSVLLLALPAACSDDGPTGPSNAPPAHTVVKSGARHAPGLQSATRDCTACHGADLRGGDNGEPSCFRCHGKKWS